VGDFAGVSPSGQKLAGHIFSFLTIADGKISRYRLFSHLSFDPPLGLAPVVAVASGDESQQR
jgi:hypothetical protein